MRIDLKYLNVSVIWCVLCLFSTYFTSTLEIQHEFYASEPTPETWTCKSKVKKTPIRTCTSCERFSRINNETNPSPWTWRAGLPPPLGASLRDQLRLSSATPGLFTDAAASRHQSVISMSGCYLESLVVSTRLTWMGWMGQIGSCTASRDKNTSLRSQHPSHSE